jgi:hypothetical protein
MVIPIQEAQQILAAPKQVFDSKDWQPKANRESRTPVLFFEARIRIASAVPRGIRFRISVFPRFPDVATFQLEYEQPGKRTLLTLYRLDWRPLSGHGNGRNGPEELWDLTFEPGVTHEHICLDNLSFVENRVLKSGVQSARRVEPDFSCYEDALTYVCGRLNIINRDEIPLPKAQGEFF